MTFGLDVFSALGDLVVHLRKVFGVVGRGEEEVEREKRGNDERRFGGKSLRSTID